MKNTFRVWIGDRMEYNVVVGKGIAYFYNENADCVTKYENLPIMQSTSLHDKNGKEIYESDLVKCVNKYDEEFVLEVKWIEHLAGWYYVDKTCKEGEWISQLRMFDNGEEIIGNIYQNPELLT